MHLINNRSCYFYLYMYPIFYPYTQLVAQCHCARSYQHQCTGSHQNSTVKRAWARAVLRWVTSWEVLVLHPLFSFLFTVDFTRM